MLIGGWARRRSIDFGPFFAFAVLLFGFSALISAVHVPGGTFIHSAVALAPYSYILAIEGIVIGAGWLATRRPAWDAAAAARTFVVAAVGFAVVFALAGSIFVHASWSTRADRFAAAATGLESAGATDVDRVMSIDASGTRYWTGHGGVVLVNDPLATIEQVARAYDIKWLVVDSTDAGPAMSAVVAGTDDPSWLGDPVTAEQGSPILLYPVEPAA
jgi:hypothetical protein